MDNNENQIHQCKHCTRSFKSPMGLRSHMKVHKQKQPSGEASSSSNPQKDEAKKVLMMTMAMVVQEEQSLPLQMIVPSHYNAAEDQHVPRRRQYVCVDCDMSFNSHYALGGHRSSKHSLTRLQRRSRRLRLFGVNLNVRASS